ncbi:hypothetical protein EV363DRAFT_1317381 [Boletus edulis]|nr:hypothetical protein EV363DRAFT_1317381 [Boletus edulis]
MARIGALASLEDGLVFLWAMEKIYLDAWSIVYAALPEASSSQTVTAKAITDLSYNWSSSNPDFAQFVKELGDLVDDYFTPVMAGHSLAGRSAREALAYAEAIWTRVIELEAGFWPDEGEEDTLRNRHTEHLAL